MFGKAKCECGSRRPCDIDSFELADSISQYFSEQIEKGLFVEEQNKQPCYVWRKYGREVNCYATEWVRCTKCGCLWELEYPALPIHGFLRKYKKGIYTGTELVDDELALAKKLLIRLYNIIAVDRHSYMTYAKREILDIIDCIDDIKNTKRCATHEEKERLYREYNSMFIPRAGIDEYIFAFADPKGSPQAYDDYEFITKAIYKLIEPERKYYM